MQAGKKNGGQTTSLPSTHHLCALARYETDVTALSAGGMMIHRIT
jgi:hypothetical protein